MDPLLPSLTNAGPPQPVPAGMAGLAILLTELTQALAKLPPGAQIPALVTAILPQLTQAQPPPAAETAAPTGTPAAGLLLQLSTADGPAQVRVPANLQISPGARLELSVAVAGPQPQWRLTALDGKPVSSFFSAAPAAAAPAPAAAAMQTEPRPAPGIAATLVKSADPALPSGTTLLVRIAALAPPAPGTAQPPLQPAEAVAEPASGAERSAPVVTPPPAIPAQATDPAPVADGVSVPEPAPPQPPTEIGGEILANNDAGRALIRTPMGLLALSVEPQSVPPAGAHITLAVIGKPVPPGAPSPAPPPDALPDKALTRRLDDLVEQLRGSGDEKLAEAVKQAIPAPGPRLAAQLLSVMASAESEHSRGLPRLLGDGLAAAIAHGAPEAMARLSRQWEAISQPAQGPDNGEWRTLLMPLMIGGQIDLVRLTTRRRRRGMSGVDREKGTRFLLDLDLSRLGPMQFDGLVKRQHKRFDLIIRTKAPLPGAMRRDIDGLFLNGLVNFGLQGSVAFQPDGRFVTTAPLTGDGSGIIFA